MNETVWNWEQANREKRNAQKRARREKLRKEGLCVECRKPSDGKWLCVDCGKKPFNQENWERYYAKNKEQIIARRRVAHEARKAEGICRECDKPVDTSRNSIYCAFHAERRSGTKALKRGWAVVKGKRITKALGELQRQLGKQWPEVEEWCTEHAELWVEKPEWFLYNYLPLEDYLKYETAS